MRAGMLHSSYPPGWHPWAWLRAAKLIPGFKGVLQDQSLSQASNNYLVSIMFQPKQAPILSKMNLQLTVPFGS